MKTKFYFGAFAALALGFASCSSDEPINGPVDPDGPTTGEKYMAVVLNDIGSSGRALPGDTDFEGPAAGSNEGKFETENVRFYFFTDKGQPFVMLQTGVNGEVSETNMVAPTELEQVNDNGEGAFKKGLLVLGKPAKYVGEKPAKVFCVANPIKTDFVDYANKPLSDLKKIEVIYDTEKNPDSTFGFTSSTYELDGTEVYYTDVTDHLESTAEAAMNNPAKIFLERLVAKVRVKGLELKDVKEKATDADAPNPIKSFKINGLGDDVKLKADLVGWELVKNAKRTYAVKDIFSFIGADKGPFDDWNDATRHRSYWANTACAGNDDFFKRTYDIYTDAFPLKSFDINNPKANVAYCYGNTRFATDLEEETIANPATARTTNATAIVVKAIIKQEGSNDGLNFVYWGGEYFTPGSFRQLVANRWNTEHKITDDALKVQPNEEDIRFIKGSSANSYKVEVKGNEWSYFDDILWWKEGVTSYYLNVKHRGNKFGVVRNHIYDYEISDVIGLGVPGNDPEDPKKPEETYLAAVVYCLNWNLVSHKVDLE